MFNLFRRLLRPSIRVVVDLRLLLPSGLNGGIRPVTFAFLEWIGRNYGRRFKFVFLTNTWTAADVEALLRPGDRLWCVHDIPAQLPADVGPVPRRALSADAPRTIGEIEADLYYNPLCEELPATGDLPVVVLHTDLLHRDCPWALDACEVARRERFFAENAARATEIQTISEFSRAQFSTHFPEVREKVFVTLLPLQERFPEERLADSVRLWAQRPYFFYPANYWPHKNHRFLINAFAEYVRQSGLDAWNLALCGEGTDDYLAITELIQQLRLDERVHHFGHLAEADYVALFRRAGALVYPSRYEGFGLPPLEAMHLGVPVLGSRAGALVEVCGPAALLVDATDSAAWVEGMRRLAEDPELRQQLVGAGRVRTGRFGLVREARKLAQCWERVAALGRRNRT